MNLTFVSTVPEWFSKRDDLIYVAIVGSRYVNDYDFVKSKFLSVLSELDTDIKKVVIVSGGANGVDTLSKEIASEFQISHIEILPDWKRYGKSAGFIRNKEIVNLSDIVIAIPSDKSKGTFHSIELAKKLSKKLFVFHY